MALGYAQFRTEATPGTEATTPTYGSKVLYPPALNVFANLNPTPMERDDEIRNFDEPLAVLEEIFRPDWGFEARMYPDLVGMTLRMMLGAPVTTAGNGIITDPDAVVIPVGATRHVWTAPFGPTGATPQTNDIRLAYRDQAAYLQAKGAAISSLSLSVPESGGARIQASGPCLFLGKISDPALTPAYEALTVLPFMRRHMTLSWLSGSAASEDFSVGISNPVEVSPTLGVASGYPDLIEKAEGPVVFTGSVPKRSLATQDWDALKAATGFAATAKWVSSSIIATSYPYKLFIAFSNVQLVDGGFAPLENKRRIPSQYGFKATSTGTAGHVTITLVNATASYA